jgi:predicted AAA+ superfamily ATPase
MATSNRERVLRGLDIMAAGLGPFVDATMREATPGDRDWVEVLEARSGRRGQYSKSDPWFQLKVINDEWRVFRDKLSRAERSFAGELLDTRNRLMHGTAFSAGDTYRALDTMERLLTGADAVAEATEVRKLRMDAQRAALEAETQRAVRSAAGVEGTGLKPWREVIIPHEDVRSGNFNASEFAADLHAVATGEGSAEYTDPVEFFRRTYLTDGLKDLLLRAARRMGGDLNASPVVNLQTNFGGGKTHSMLALWHMLSGRPLREYPQPMQELLAGHDMGVLGQSARCAALVGTYIKAGKGSVKCAGTPYETQVNTLWGELAWQLGCARDGDAGGRAAYAIVADADATRSNPGDALGELIRRYAPCLILIDEWVAYARQLYGRDDLAGGSFDTQFTFAQTLAESVTRVPGAMLVVSIPASSEVPTAEEQERGATDIEIGGIHGSRALERLQQVIRRIADQWRPASSYESFAIVRQRLFEETDTSAQADIAAVARMFTHFYGRHKAEFPTGVSDTPYEERIKAAYPIHPELFDRLYEDWSTLERFQRTRGVLRLMSAVIHELWRDDDPAPLIMPGGIPLDAHRVRDELCQYLEDGFKPAIDADIDGYSATPARIDASRVATLGQRRVTRRIARAIFLGSAPTLRAAHRGIEQPRVWLGVATPGDTVGNFGSALHLLSDQATYLYSDNARYWYATQATVAKMARDHAERLREHPDEARKEILDRLRRLEAGSRRVFGMFARVQVGPESSAEISDDPVVRLVILRLEQTHTRGDGASKAMVFAIEAVQYCGNSLRMNRNMIVFLAPDAKRAEELDQAARDYLAWRSINDRRDELDLSTQQAVQAERRLREADETVNLRITATYQWVLAPVQRDAKRPMTLEETRADTTRDRLAERASDRLYRDDRIRTEQDARNIRIDLDEHLPTVWDRGYIRVGDLWDYYCRYAYLPRLRDRPVLDAGILSVFDVQAWESQGFAVAQGYDEATGKYDLLAIPQQDARPQQITDLTLLVSPEQAMAQRAQERAEQEAVRAGAGGGQPGESAGAGVGGDGTVRSSGEQFPGGASDTGQAGAGTATGTPPPRNTRFYGVAEINPERYGRDFTRLQQEIIQHLAAPDDVELEIKVDIRAHKKDGYPDDKVRIVTENARTLKFDTYGFEDR